MGYTYTPTLYFIELYTLPNAVVYIDTTLDDHELNPFPATAYTGTITYAYMDLIVPCIRNASGSDNHINGFTLQLKDSGATWRNAMIAPDPTLWIESNDTQHGNVELCGTTNIAEYIQNNAVMYPRIYQDSADSNGIYFYDTMCRLRLYFQGS